MQHLPNCLHIPSASARHISLKTECKLLAHPRQLAAQAVYLCRQRFQFPCLYSGMVKIDLNLRLSDFLTSFTEYFASVLLLQSDSSPPPQCKHQPPHKASRDNRKSHCKPASPRPSILQTHFCSCLRLPRTSTPLSGSASTQSDISPATACPSHFASEQPFSTTPL